jgi:uncharacterized repeat protein (TIGR01451 family)
MGRRQLVILGISLVVAASASLARGQDEGQNRPPAAPPPVESKAQDDTPAFLSLPQAPAAGETDEVGDGRAGKATAEGAKREPAKSKTTKPKTKSAPKSDPPREVGSEFDGPFKGAGPADAELDRPRTDENLVRAQAPAGGGGGGGGAPAPAVPAGKPANAAVDVLPLGKQSVAVTVDVQAPSSMYLNQEATLKLIVRNTGANDALNLAIEDELPEGLQYITSVPEMRDTGQHLSARIAILPAGSDRTYSIRVKPTKHVPFDHVATVRFETGCRSRTVVLEPKLKVDVVARPTEGKVLKGQAVQFDVTVSNLGDGPARNVAIQARLSAGLRHEVRGKSDEPILYELTLPELMPNQKERLDPLVADAVVGGEQNCKVVATSPDAVFVKEDAEITKTISVVEPKLKLSVQGPDERFTDTIADYEIVLENPGSAPARKIRVTATLPTSGKLVGKLPSDARYDSTTRRLTWTIDQLEPNAKTLQFPFHFQMGGIGRYEVLAEAIGANGLKAEGGIKRTDVKGMPDVDLVVSESKRVLDVGGVTRFNIRIANYGTKEATNLQLSATLSDNLEVQDAGGGSKDVVALRAENKHAVSFEQINKLGPGKDMKFGILVKVVGVAPRLATCKVVLTHDDLSEHFEDMAGVKVTTGRGAATAPAAAAAPATDATPK